MKPDKAEATYEHGLRAVSAPAEMAGVSQPGRMLDPRLSDFVSTIVRSGVVPGNALPALESEIACAVRWKNAWLPEAMCLLAAALLSLFAAQLHLSGKTAALDPARGCGFQEAGVISPVSGLAVAAASSAGRGSTPAVHRVDTVKGRLICY